MPHSKDQLKLKIALVLVGDSDMKRWSDTEEHLLPSLSSKQNLAHHHITLTHFHQHAKSGAVMQNLSKQVTKAMKEVNDSSRGPFDTTVFIACAGENDLSSNTPIDNIMLSFEAAVETIFESNANASVCSNQRHLIFIGPKVEPWMETDELDARKGYFTLSERLNQTCQRFRGAISEKHAGHGPGGASTHDCDAAGSGRSIVYIDSLTMFCGETSSLSVIGGVGGKAIAEKSYFNEDGLHLSHDGYEVWKREVEAVLERLICGEDCGESLDKSHYPSIDL